MQILILNLKVMNKRFLKSTLVVAMIAIIGYGSHKAYEKYAENSNWLLMENVEALSQLPEYVNYGYFFMHLNCFDTYGNTTKEKSATAYPGTKEYPGPCKVRHEHSCKTCSFSCK